MQSVYLLTLVGVGIAIVAALFEAVSALRRKPHWELTRPAPALTVVPTADRRAHELPFVGTERRTPDGADEATEAAHAASKTTEAA
ncbi:MAG: hypothetical protein ABI696_03490 [Rubrivivax sp.]